MWTCRSQIAQRFLLLNSKSLLVKWEWDCEAQPSSETYSKLSSALGTVTCFGTPENTQPLSLSPPPDGLMLHKSSGPLRWWRGWVKPSQAFVKPCFCAFQSVNRCSFSLRNTRSMEVISSQKPVESLFHKCSMREPCSALQGEQEGSQGAREEKPEQREGGRWQMWKQPWDFCSYLFFKVWGHGYVGDKGKDRRRGGKTSGAQYVLSSASPAHLQWEALMGFPERLVAAAASLSCCS